MKRMQERQTRKNESAIIAKLGEIAVDVAVIKNEQVNTNEHLKTLNGKVATQEGRQQAQEGAVALITQSVSILQGDITNLKADKTKQEEKKLNFWERNAEKIILIILTGVLSFVFANFK